MPLLSVILSHDQIFPETETMGVIIVRLLLMTMMFIVLVPNVVQGDPPAAAVELCHRWWLWITCFVYIERTVYPNIEFDLYRRCAKAVREYCENNHL